MVQICVLSYLMCLLSNKEQKSLNFSEAVHHLFSNDPKYT
uniref:Uncharacterized protein n=1 Tax=Anguilla anguilla TaxID=7936 RepID=A0A0E9PT44_ANGAN